MDDKKRFYSNAAVIVSSDKDSVIVFRNVGPELNENDEVISSSVRDEIEIFMSHEQLVGLVNAIQSNIKRRASKKVDEKPKKSK